MNSGRKICKEAIPLESAAFSPYMPPKMIYAFSLRRRWQSKIAG